MSFDRELGNEVGSEPGGFTELLARSAAGDSEAQRAVWERAYKALHWMARERMRSQSSRHTLQPTALVHEVFLKLLGSRALECRDRKHFLRAASSAMRSVLVDHARNRDRLKRGAGAHSVPLDSLQLEYEQNAIDLLTLEDCLRKLATFDERMSQLVELRFFGGCSTVEAAQILQISERQAQRDWSFARRWLYDELESAQ